MIKFSKYLQDNERTKKKAEEKILNETRVLEEKKAEITKQKAILKRLKVRGFFFIFFCRSNRTELTTKCAH